MAAWFVWSVADLPPFRVSDDEVATSYFLTAVAMARAIIYAISAVPYARIFRHRLNLLPAAVVACFALLAEAIVRVAVTRELKWHASWWNRTA